MKVIFNGGHIFKRGLIKKLFAKALELTNNEVEDLIVSVKFVSKEEIQKLNNNIRGVDKVTDVLSFPMLEIKQGEHLKDFDSEREPDGWLNLGDIALCVDKAKQQAKDYGNSYKREIAFLALHGFLHLLGYDHIEKEDEKKMMSLAENVLANFNIKRG